MKTRSILSTLTFHFYFFNSNKSASFNFNLQLNGRNPNPTPISPLNLSPSLNRNSNLLPHSLIASMGGSKRSRSSLSPIRPESPLPPEFPETMSETDEPTMGAQKSSQNLNLATTEPDMGVQQEKQAPKSSMCFGLPTSDPAERSSPTGFGEFLQACRWCRKKIDQSLPVYMYGYLGAFCSPECREILIELDRFLAKRNSKSGGKAVKGPEHAEER